MPVLLAFDTATDRLNIALAVDEQTFVHEAPGGALTSAALIPAIQSLLAEAGLEMAAIDAIGYGQGPGAFTGLRAACSVAQGLAFGLGRPVLALDTLMAVAEDVRLAHGAETVWVTMDARMDEIYAASYRRTVERWQVLEAPALYTLEALAQRWQQEPPQAVAGTAVAAFGDRLPSGMAQRWPEALPRARALACLARAAWADGALLDAAEARPLYLRDKVASTTAERDAARRVKEVAA